jgi:hypothetical protein
MRKLTLIIAIVFSGMLVQAQSLTRDTIYFENGYNKACLIVGDSEHHIYAKIISMDLNPGDTTIVSYKKLLIVGTSNARYPRKYFKKYQVYLNANNTDELVNNFNKEPIGKIAGAESFAIAIHDQREMIVDGSKNETLLGYRYAKLYGNAYALYTKPKENFSDYFLNFVSNELSIINKPSDNVKTRSYELKSSIINQLKSTPVFIFGTP